MNRTLKWLMFGGVFLLLVCLIGTITQAPAQQTGDELVATFNGGSSPEGIQIRYWSGWYRDGEPVYEGVSQWIDAPYTVPGASTPGIPVNRGEVWRVEIRIEDADGIYSLENWEASVTVGGQPPTGPVDVVIEVMKTPPPAP